MLNKNVNVYSMAKGGVITGEFKDARYAKGKIAYYPPKSEDFWKNREMRLAQAKGVSGKWSHREKAYIMSKGQAETLKKYLKEGKDVNFISGEIYDNDGYMAKGGEFDITVKSTEELKYLVTQEREKKIKEWYKLGVRVVVGRNDGYWFETTIGEAESISSSNPSNRKIIDFIKNNPTITKIGFQGTIKAGNRVGQELEIVDDFSVVLWKKNEYMKNGGLTLANKFKAKVIHNENRFEYYENDNLITPTSSQKFYWDMFGFPKGVERKEELFVTEIDEISGKTKKEVYSVYENNLKEGKYHYINNINELFLVFDKKMSDGGYMESGGEIDYENKDMLLNQAIEIMHHAKELQDVVNKINHVESWVIAKIERSATDLSDVTHYLDGESKKMSDGGYMAKGGRIKESDVKVGEVFTLKNGEEIKIVRLFQEKYGATDKDYVEFTRNGKTYENSVNQLKIFINNWKM